MSRPGPLELLLDSVAGRITQDFVVALNLVHRRADAFDDAREKSRPSEERRVLALHARERFHVGHPRRLVKLWIVHGHSKLDRVGASARIALLDPRLSALRKTKDIDPGAVVEADRIHDERIAVPSP